MKAALQIHHSWVMIMQTDDRQEYEKHNCVIKKKCMKYFALLLLDFPCSDKSLVCASGKPFAGAVSNNVSSDCSCSCSFHMGIRIFISLVLPATLLVRGAILIMLLS